MKFGSTLLLLLCIVMHVIPSQVPISVMVKMGRKRYAVSKAKVVQDILDDMKSSYGVEISDAKHSILYNGTRLRARDTLQSIGMKSGSTIDISHIVKEKLKTNKPKKVPRSESYDDDSIPEVDTDDLKSAMKKIQSGNPMEILSGFVDNDDVYQIFNDKKQIVRREFYSVA